MANFVRAIGVCIAMTLVRPCQFAMASVSESLSTLGVMRPASRRAVGYPGGGLVVRGDVVVATRMACRRNCGFLAIGKLCLQSRATFGSRLHLAAWTRIACNQGILRIAKWIGAFAKGQLGYRSYGWPLRARIKQSMMFSRGGSPKKIPLRTESATANQWRRKPPQRVHCGTLSSKKSIVRVALMRSLSISRLEHAFIVPKGKHANASCLSIGLHHRLPATLHTHTEQ